MAKKPLNTSVVTGFYLIVLGVVFSVLINTVEVASAFEFVKWLGFITMVSGLVLIMIPLIKDRQRERKEKRRNY